MDLQTSPLAWFSNDVANIMMANNGCCFSKEIISCIRNSDIQISSQWGNPDDSKKKIKATIMNHKWMKNYMVQFSNKKIRRS